MIRHMKKLVAGILIFVSFAAFVPLAMARTAAPKKPVKHPPKYYQSARRAAAECEDGTLYFGRHVKSACSAHEGVMQWFR